MSPQQQNLVARKQKLESLLGRPDILSAREQEQLHFELFAVCRELLDGFRRGAA